MNKNPNDNKSLEQEFRSSQIYKTLSGSGIPAADKVAQGLDQAAQGVDRAISDFSAAVNRSAPGPAQTNYIKVPPQGTQPSQPQGSTPRSAPYQYHYTYPAGSRQNGSAQPGQVGQYPQSGSAQVHPGQKPAGVSPAPAPQMPPMKVVYEGSPMKYYITAAAAVLYATNFPMYSPIHYLFFGLAIAGAFFLSGKIFKGKKSFVPVTQAAPVPEKKKKVKKQKAPTPVETPAEQPKPSRTGNPEVDKIIDEGNDYLKRLRAANDAIPDEALSEDIDRMEKASADIFRYIADHPNKAPEIRKFMSYYLPTTLKLLNSYQRLSQQSAKGENITSTMFNIAGMMHTVADAFEKQLDSLFTDEAMDISTDISVFETLLKQEGFVSDEVRTQTRNKRKTEEKN